VSGNAASTSRAAEIVAAALGDVEPHLDRRDDGRAAQVCASEAQATTRITIGRQEVQRQDEGDLGQDERVRVLRG
jgi:hypothetical protein